jgi:putative tricarboxylic transport membrane protein
VPLLALGIPFGSITALMLAAMMIHGVQPGPMLITNNPEIFWGVIVSMYIGNVMLLILNVPLVGVWVSLLRIPNHIFLPLILLMAVIGSYSVSNSMLDVYLLLFLGVLGYVLRKFNFQLAPMVVGLVLGPELEKHVREGLFMSQGELSVFYSSPIAIGVWVVVFLVLTAGIQRMLFAKLFGIKPGKITIESAE